MTDAAQVPWRVGRKLGRTIYAEDGTDEGTLLGMVDTVGIAQHVVKIHNLLVMSEYVTEYGHMVKPVGQPDAYPVWVNEPKGPNYATSQRGVYRLPPELIGKPG